MKKSQNDWFTKTAENVSFIVIYSHFAPMRFTGADSFDKALQEYLDVPECERFSLTIEIDATRFSRKNSQKYFPIIRKNFHTGMDRVNPWSIKKIENIDISNWVEKAEKALKASYNPEQTYVDRINIQMENYSANTGKTYSMTPILEENLKKLQSITEKEYDIIDLMGGTNINKFAEIYAQEIAEHGLITPLLDHRLYDKNVWSTLKIIEDELSEQPIRGDLENLKKKISVHQGFIPEKNLLKDIHFYIECYNLNVLGNEQILFPDFVSIDTVLNCIDHPSSWLNTYLLKNNFESSQDIVEFQDTVEKIAFIIMSEKMKKFGHQLQNL